MNAFVQRLARVPLLALLLTLAACGDQELYSKLSERQANEMVAVLRSTGLAGNHSDGKRATVKIPNFFTGAANHN